MSFVSSSVKREKERVSESFSCGFCDSAKGKIKKNEDLVGTDESVKSNTSASKAKTVSLCISSILYAV